MRSSVHACHSLDYFDHTPAPPASKHNAPPSLEVNWSHDQGGHVRWRIHAKKCFHGAFFFFFAMCRYISAPGGGRTSQRHFRGFPKPRRFRDHYFTAIFRLCAKPRGGAESQPVCVESVTRRPRADPLAPSLHLLPLFVLMHSLLGPSLAFSTRLTSLPPPPPPTKPSLPTSLPLSPPLADE